MAFGNFDPEKGYAGLTAHTAVDGRIVISENVEGMVPDLGPLRALERIDELVIMSTEHLTSIDFIPRISHIGTLIVKGNRALRNLDGLKGLSSTSIIVLDDNEVLERVSFPGLRQCKKRFEIRRNPSLVGITDMDKLQKTDATFMISENDSLVSITNISAMTVISKLVIRHCAKLQVLNAFTRLSLASFIHISECPQLNEMAFPSLRNFRNFTLSGTSAQIAQLLAQLPAEVPTDRIEIGRNNRPLPGCSSLFAVDVFALIIRHLDVETMVHLSEVSQKWHAEVHMAVRYAKHRVTKTVTFVGCRRDPHLPSSTTPVHGLTEWAWDGLKIRLVHWPELPPQSLVPHISYYQPTAWAIYGRTASLTNLTGINTLDLSDMTQSVTDELLPSLAGFRNLNLKRCGMITTVAPLVNVSRLDLTDCVWIRDLAPLARVHTLILKGASPQDYAGREWSRDELARLGNVTTLDLSSNALEDVSMLDGVTNLNLRDNNITDVRALGNVTKLDLSDNQSLTDVRALANVSHLKLDRCTRLANISMLDRVHTLSLMGCWQLDLAGIPYLANMHTLDLSFTRVNDVSALGGVHTLRLNNCRNIVDVSALRFVHDLDLSNCTGVTDASMLDQVTLLNLANCTGLIPGTFIQHLGGVSRLDLSGCPIRYQDSLAPLRNVQQLTLDHCTEITDVSALSDVRILSLGHCSGLSVVSALRRVYVLNLSDTSVADVSALGGVHSLYIMNCTQLQDDLSALGSVNTLYLRNSKVHPTAHGLVGNNYHLDLTSTAIANVDSLAGVTNLVLRDCVNVRDVSALHAVRTLDLTNCSQVYDLSNLAHTQLLISGTGFASSMEVAYGTGQPAMRRALNVPGMLADDYLDWKQNLEPLLEEE